MITLDVDSTEISSTLRQLAMLTGKYEKITAIAMSKAAAAAKQKIASDILPQIEGGPTAWTRRGLRYWRADRDRLVSAAGFNYGDNSPTDLGYSPKDMGTSSGRYMEIQARGGDRGPKSTERSLRRTGVIKSDQFIVPTGKGDKLNTHGNLPGPTYQRILSRVGAAAGPGYTSNKTNSKRSQQRRSNIDYFVKYGELGEGAQYIAKRTGSRPKGNTGKGSGKPGRPATTRSPRGFVPVLVVTDQPNYERRLDIRGVAWREYNRVFSSEFKRNLQIEISKR